jgi:histidinol-phosphate/aromatic aminotransferase/cobyric acid decarboxylase-like protein
MRATCAETAERRDRFAARVREVGLQVPESHTNFVLIRFAGAEAAKGAFEALRAEGVVLRPMAGYGLADCLRTTVGGEAEMERAAELLAAWSRKEGLT